MHRIVVIGRGMIGSAATRHLTGLVDGVAAIGPSEPADRADHDGAFASHHDEGRIARIADPDEAWAITAKRSIERYGDLERDSGIRFFTPSGYLGFGESGSDWLERLERTGRAHGANPVRLDASGIRGRFPFLSIGDDVAGLVETGTAGHISPRSFVRAQSELARRRGATLVDDEATEIRLVSGGAEILTGSGACHKAERVLVAVGAYADACGLLPAPLGLKVLGRTVAFAHLDESMREALNGMPAMVHGQSGAYILPPIRYPDGRHYVKIGVGTDRDRRLRSMDDLADWFGSPGSETDRHEYRAFLTALVPLLDRCARWHTDSCAVTWTPTGLPLIDFVADDRIAVAVGGNGKAAKSADDWGWLAARLLVEGDWDHPVTRERLKVPASRPSR